MKSKRHILKPNTISISSLFASIVAIVISGFSIYVSHFKSSDIKISTGTSFMAYHDGEDLQLSVPLVLQNSGNAGVVRSLAILIQDPENDEAYLFEGIGQRIFSDNVKEPGLWINSDSLKTPISVPKYSEVSMMYRFGGHTKEGNLKGWIPSNKKYNVHLLAWDSNNKRHQVPMEWNFTLDNINEMKSNLQHKRENPSTSSSSTWVRTSNFNSITRKLKKNELDDFFE